MARPEWLHRLPDGLSWTMGALVEPFSVAYYALVRAGGVDASDTVAVLGAGPGRAGRRRRGRRRWARVVVVVEPSADRRKAALGAGRRARRRIPTRPTDAAGRADRGPWRGRGGRGQRPPGGDGPRAGARCVPGTRRLHRHRRRGRRRRPSSGLIQSKELRITGSIGSPGVWPETLRFLANSGIDLSPIVTAAVRHRRGAGGARRRSPPATRRSRRTSSSTRRSTDVDGTDVARLASG